MGGRMGRTRGAHPGMVWYGMVWYGMVAHPGESPPRDAPCLTQTHIPEAWHHYHHHYDIQYVRHVSVWVNKIRKTKIKISVSKYNLLIESMHQEDP